MEKQITISKITVNAGMFLTCSYKELLPNNDERTHGGVKCTAPVHEDLVTAFNAFLPHLALICEEITPEQFIDSLPNEYDATQPHIMEMGEVVPAIKAAIAKRAKKAKKGDASVTMIGPDGVEHDASWLMSGDEPEKKVKTIWDRFTMHTVEFKVANGIESIILNGEKELSTLEWLGLGPTPPKKENDVKYRFISDLFQAGELLKYEVGLYILEHKYAPAKDLELPFGENGGDDEEGEFKGTMGINLG